MSVTASRSIEATDRPEKMSLFCQGYVFYFTKAPPLTGKYPFILPPQKKFSPMERVCVQCEDKNCLCQFTSSKVSPGYNESHSVVQKNYTRLYSFRFCCKIVSFTAAKTKRMFSVSVRRGRKKSIRIP